MTSFGALEHALRLREIDKRYADQWANRGVDLQVNVGAIHALVGENGAGKSTLMNVAYGQTARDAGSIEIKGRLVGRRHSPSLSIRRGLGMVHQHFMLVGNLSVVENMVLGSEPVRSPWPWIRLATVRQQIAELADRVGLPVPLDSHVEALSVGLQQRVEILKVLWRGCDVLILDEPTAVLTPQEVEKLFQVLKSLVAGGATVVLITHKLDEVVTIADKITVMRSGKVVAEFESNDDPSTEQIARAMVGKTVIRPKVKRVWNTGPVALKLEALQGASSKADDQLKDVSLSVRAGEILGVAGIEGNGQEQLVESIVGLQKPLGGSIWFADRRVDGDSVQRRFELGMGHVPSDRLRWAVVPEQSLTNNVVLGRHSDFCRAGLLQQKRVDDFAVRTLAEADVRPAEPERQLSSLSGGNQQKLVVAREVSRPDLKVLICAQPTRGVDIAAVAAIHQRILAAREAGVAILLVSSQLEELEALADRLLVFYRGRIAREFLPADLQETDVRSQIGTAMVGGGAP